MGGWTRVLVAKPLGRRRERAREARDNRLRALRARKRVVVCKGLQATVGGRANAWVCWLQATRLEVSSSPVRETHNTPRDGSLVRGHEFLALCGRQQYWRLGGRIRSVVSSSPVWETRYVMAAVCVVIQASLSLAGSNIRGLVGGRFCECVRCRRRLAG